METCFLKHCYPPGFKGKGKEKASSNTTPTATVNAILDASPQGSSTPPYGITQEQYTNILELLQQSKLNSQANSISTSPFVMHSHSSTTNGKSPNFWILDTGVTYRISYGNVLFINYINIIPVHVNLPDGSHIVASMYGSVVLSSSFT